MKVMKVMKGNGTYGTNGNYGTNGTYGTNMSHSFYLSHSSYLSHLSCLIAMLVLFSPAYSQKKSSCIECHIKLDDTRLSAPAKLFDNDIHKSRGLSCNDCHG